MWVTCGSLVGHLFSCGSHMGQFSVTCGQSWVICWFFVGSLLPLVGLDHMWFTCVALVIHFRVTCGSVVGHLWVTGVSLAGHLRVPCGSLVGLMGHLWVITCWSFVVHLSITSGSLVGHLWVTCWSLAGRFNVACVSLVCRFWFTRGSLEGHLCVSCGVICGSLGFTWGHWDHLGSLGCNFVVTWGHLGVT